MQNIDDAIKTWGIVELMGHKVVAGMVSKSEMLGAALLRVDVPATSAYPEFTQFYGTSAIYCVTFVSEEVARRTAEANKTNPVSVYVPDLVTREQMENIQKTYNERIEELRQIKGLPAGAAHRETCTWTPVENEDTNDWTTACGHVWELNNGTPMADGIQFCFYCGRLVETVDGSDDEDDKSQPWF